MYHPTLILMENQGLFMQQTAYFQKRRWYKVKVPPFNYLYKLYRLYLQVCGKSPRFNFRQLHVLFSGGIHFCLGRDAKIFENYKIDPLFDADKETDI